MTTFTCSMSPAVRIVSLVVTLALLGGTVALALPAAMGWAGPASPWLWLAAACLPATPIVTWLFAPRGYDLTADELLVRRPIGPVRIATREITAIERPTSPVIGMSIRLFASGGLFGVFGLFWSSKLGRFWMWGTRPDKLVLLRLRDGLPVILTPDDDEALASRLNTQLRQP